MTRKTQSPDWTVANRRVARIVAAAESGRTAPAAALAQIEAYGGALDRHVYDAAVDAVGAVAEQTGQTLDVQPWRKARLAPRRMSSTERRYRRRESKRQNARTMFKSLGTAGAPPNKLRTVRASSGLRGESGEVVLHHERGGCDCAPGLDTPEHAPDCASRHMVAVPGPAPVMVREVVWAPAAWAAFLPELFPRYRHTVPDRTVRTRAVRLDDVVDGRPDGKPARMVDVTYTVAGTIEYRHRTQPHTGRVDTGLRRVRTGTADETQAVLAERAERERMAALAREELEASSVPLAH